MNFNIKDLPPEKKRVLAIGGIAFVALLFLSFLVSLTEGDDAPAQAPQQQQAQQNPQSGSLNLPSSQRYDFEQGQNGQNLENLLNSQKIGESDPFANMQGSRDSVNQSAPGPAPIPTDEDEEALPQVVPPAQALSTAKVYHLHCGSFANQGDAEQRKAMLAFQGVMANVESHEGKYRLKLGPYTSRDQAQSVFDAQSATGLLESCRLVTSNQ